MEKEQRGKARWALGKAAALLQQAQALDDDRSGDWRAWRRRGDGAARLRIEAARYEQMAAKWTELTVALPF